MMGIDANTVLNHYAFEVGYRQLRSYIRDQHSFLYQWDEAIGVQMKMISTIFIIFLGT